MRWISHNLIFQMYVSVDEEGKRSDFMETELEDEEVPSTENLVA